MTNTIFTLLHLKLRSYFAVIPRSGGIYGELQLRKTKAIKWRIETSCQTTCTVRGSAFLPHKLGKCEKNVWEDTWRKVS